DRARGGPLRVRGATLGAASRPRLPAVQPGTSEPMAAPAALGQLRGQMVEARLRADARSEAGGQGGELPAIQLERGIKHFPAGAGNVQAVEQVDLSIAEGEFFSLLGPSGCGKTTTLRMIAGFEEPTDGRILLHGRVVVGVPPYRRDVNMVFQHYALFPHMNVFDNV